jgi:cytochrome bd-type quinol oxidase subunit 2
MPITVMLLALVFRGVAFEYRWRAKRWRGVWDFSFFGGSLLATFTQGIALGALVQGIEVENRAYSGGWWDWLTPFSLFTGAALVAGYALLGATWLVMKTEGPLQSHMRDLAKLAGIALLAAIAIVSAWMPFLDASYYSAWFTGWSIGYVVLVPALVAACGLMLFRGLLRGRERTPFIAALGLFVTGFIGLGIGFYPNIVPPSLTIVEAAAPDESLAFTLVGAAVLIPLILLLSIVGAYAVNNAITDVYWMLGFGVFGYFMRHYGYPLGPVILGVILSRLLDDNWRRAIISEREDLGRFFYGIVTSPLSLCLLVAVILIFVSQTPLWTRFRKKESSAK